MIENARYAFRLSNSHGECERIEKALTQRKDFRRTGTNMVSGEKGLRYEVYHEEVHHQGGTAEDCRSVSYWGSTVATIVVPLSGRQTAIKPHIRLSSFGWETKQTKDVINAAINAFLLLTGTKDVGIYVTGKCKSRRCDEPAWSIVVTREGKEPETKRWYGERVNVFADGTWTDAKSRELEAEELKEKEVEMAKAREDAARLRKVLAEQRTRDRILARKADKLAEKWSGAPLASLRMGEKPSNN